MKVYFSGFWNRSIEFGWKSVHNLTMIREEAVMTTGNNC
jgi:hypothetical protein